MKKVDECFGELSSVPDVLAWFITFTTYGTWLHGDRRGSVDRNHNQPHTPYLPPDPIRYGRLRNDIEPYLMDEPRREAALEGIVSIVEKRRWTLHACHVRPNHVHALITAPEPVELVQNSLKTAASRELNRRFPQERKRTRWTRHGSTRYVWDETAFHAIRRYILDGQGDAMSVYPPVAPQPTEPRTECNEVSGSQISTQPN